MGMPFLQKLLWSPHPYAAESGSSAMGVIRLNQTVPK